MPARTLHSFYLAAFCGLLLICVPCMAAAQVVGTVSKVQKQAQVGSTPAASGTPVNMNDVVTTGEGARLQITFRDETSLTLGENARIVVDRYVYNPASSTGVLSLNASLGAFRFATGKISEMTNKQVTVTTPAATLGVRGTEFWSGIVPGYDTYGVLLISSTGKVDVRNPAGGVTLSKQGEGTDIPPSLKADQPPSPPEIWTADKMAAALSTTQFGFALLTPNLLPAALLAAAIIAVIQDDDDDKRDLVSPN